MKPRSRADRFRWYWKLQSRIDSLQVRYLGTSILALFLRTPVLLIETIGRRSGRTRRTPVAYWAEGDVLFVGGGAAGMTRVDWVANIRANPHAAVWVRRQRRDVVARELAGAEEEAARAYAFKRWPNAAKYEQRSGRRVPYFRLEGASVGTSF